MKIYVRFVIALMMITIGYLGAALPLQPNSSLRHPTSSVGPPSSSLRQLSPSSIRNLIEQEAMLCDRIESSSMKSPLFSEFLQKCRSQVEKLRKMEREGASENEIQEEIIKSRIESNEVQKINNAIQKRFRKQQNVLNDIKI